LDFYNPYDDDTSLDESDGMMMKVITWKDWCWKKMKIMVASGDFSSSQQGKIDLFVYMEETFID
jgi:hypothetical protein